MLSTLSRSLASKTSAPAFLALDQLRAAMSTTATAKKTSRVLPGSAAAAAAAGIAALGARGKPVAEPAHESDTASDGDEDIAVGVIEDINKLSGAERKAAFGQWLSNFLVRYHGTFGGLIRSYTQRMTDDGALIFQDGLPSLEKLAADDQKSGVVYAALDALWDDTITTGFAFKENKAPSKRFGDVLQAYSATIAALQKEFAAVKAGVYIDDDVVDLLNEIGSTLSTVYSMTKVAISRSVAILATYSRMVTHEEASTIAFRQRFQALGYIVEATVMVGKTVRSGGFSLDDEKELPFDEVLKVAALYASTFVASAKEHFANVEAAKQAGGEQGHFTTKQQGFRPRGMRYQSRDE